MQDTVTESEDRVPVFGAIPLLGNLFKSRSGSRQKSNLLVFLRPKILRDQPATEAVSDSKYNEIRQEERTLHKGKIWLLPGEKQPSIPPMLARRPRGASMTHSPRRRNRRPRRSRRRAHSPAPAPQPAPPSAQPAPAPRSRRPRRWPRLRCRLPPRSPRRSPSRSVPSR